MSRYLAVTIFCLLTAQAEAQQYPKDSPVGALQSQGISFPRRIPGPPCTAYPAVKVRIPPPNGSMVIDLKITADGSVKDVVVEQSSGETEFDKMMVECVAQYRYQPAMKDGQPVEVPWKIAMKFGT